MFMHWNDPLTPLMDPLTTCSPHEGLGRTEEPISGGSELIKEDPRVVLHVQSPETQQNTDLRPDFAVSPNELTKNALGPSDGPSCETDLGPVISPGLIHSHPWLPHEFTEGGYSGDTGVIPENAKLAEAPSGSSTMAVEPPFTLPGPDSTPTVSFSEMLESLDVQFPHIYDFLNQDHSVSYLIQPHPSGQLHENSLAHLQNPPQIPEYSAQPQLQSQQHRALQENDQGPSSMAGPDRFETTEKGTLLPLEDNLNPGPNVRFPTQFDPTDLLCNSDLAIEPEGQETQLPCCSQHFQPQPFWDASEAAPHPFGYISPYPGLSTVQPPVSFHSNCPQPVQLFNSLDVNCIQSENQLNLSCVQSSLRPSGSLPPPVVYSASLNPASSTSDNCPPLVPQVNLTSGSSESHPHHNHPPPICKKDLQMSFSCHSAHAYSQAPSLVSSLEQPLVVQCRSGTHILAQEPYVDYTLWRMYCKVANSVYSSSPDAEALACFFIPVIRAFILQQPTISLPVAVKKAVLEWGKHSYYGRMKYYWMAQKFMDFEEEQMKMLWVKEQATASPKASLQSDKFTGDTLMQRSGGGRRVQRAIASSKGRQELHTDEDLFEKAVDCFCEVMEFLESKSEERRDDDKEEEVQETELEKWVTEHVEHRSESHMDSGSERHQMPDEARAERNDDGREEMVETRTTAEGVSSERIVDGLPIKEQTPEETEELMSELKSELPPESPITCSAEADHIPSSSNTPGLITEVTPATPVSPSEKNDGENGGKSGKRSGSESGQKAQAGATGAGKKSRGNERQTSSFLKGIKVRWSDRLHKMQRRRARRQDKHQD